MTILGWSARVGLWLGWITVSSASVWALWKNSKAIILGDSYLVPGVWITVICTIYILSLGAFLHDKRLFWWRRVKSPK